MNLMGKIGEINVLVGDEVAGTLSAELIDVPWDKALQAILDMKNYASDVDVASNLIRIHAPETLTAQENYKSQRAQAVKKKVELEDSVEPIFSEIFRLYYISPQQAKATIEELFQQGSGDGSFTPIQITEEITTRSIIVRGKSEDLDVVDKIISEIDVRTKQVLIEAFIVEVDSEFERALGTRLGGTYQKNQESVGGIVGGAMTDGAVSGTTGSLAGDAGSISNFPAVGATSGIGILKRTGTGTITLGQSGDTIAIPSGATIANSGTATGFGGNNTPAFFVRNSANQDMSHGVETLCTLDTEILDTDNAFASNKFTPQTAGKYFITFQAMGSDDNATSGNLAYVFL